MSIGPARQRQTPTTTSNEGNRQSIPGRPPRTREVPAGNTHRGTQTLSTACRLLRYRSSRAISKLSEVKETAPKLTITGWALVAPDTQRCL